MLTPKDIDRVDDAAGMTPSVAGDEHAKQEIRWLADQLKKADAFNKELLNQIYQLRATLKMVL